LPFLGLGGVLKAEKATILEIETSPKVKEWEEWFEIK